MKYVIAAIVLLGGAILTTAVDRALGVEVKSPNSPKRLVHNLLLMAQGGAIMALIFHL